MRSLARILIAAALLASATLPAGADSMRYSIDVILPVTGPAAFAGRSQVDAAHVYEAIVNKTGGIHGQPVHFEIHDDQSSPTVAVQIVNDLLTRHPIVVLGPDVTATCAAVSPLFVNGPVNFCFSPAIVPPRGGYVFASSATLQSLVYAGYARAAKLGYKRLGVLIATDASGQQDLKFTNDSLALPQNKSMQLVALETFSPTDISATAQVAKIKAAKPDIIFVWAIGSAFGTALREIANAGLDVPLATSPSNANEEQLAQYKSFLPKVLLTTGSPYQTPELSNKALKAAANEYLDATSAAGVKPNPMQAYAWDPIKITIAALRQLPPNPTATQLRDRIETLHDLSGLFGTYDFRTGDQHGLDGSDSRFIMWDGAASRWIYFNASSAKAG
jgi:branched-chain amino acid transport system substrate-binding protein